jgi:hypothetical protein
MANHILTAILSMVFTLIIVNLFKNDNIVVKYIDKEDKKISNRAAYELLHKDSNISFCDNRDINKSINSKPISNIKSVIKNALTKQVDGDLNLIKDIELLNLNIGYESMFNTKVLEYIRSHPEYENYYTINRDLSDIDYIAITLTLKKSKKSVIKKIVIDFDRTPSIILNGLDVINLDIYEPYIEQGALVIDYEDGDISNLCEIKGAVDSTTIGTYYIKYYIEDSYGHKVVKYRTVRVVD